MSDAIPFQLLNCELAERKTRPVNKISYYSDTDQVARISVGHTQLLVKITVNA
jgi:hypothetical protein